jgi:all-trans-retinol dehydrogenase (NAD+)
MTELRGRHVLITGGASGIGRAMAKRFAAQGGRVSLWDLNEANLARTLEELKAAGAEAPHGFLCDVARRERVYEVARATVAAAGPVDILVSNTLSLFWVTRAFLPSMIERRAGHVVTIASASALVGVARLSDYAASKWAAMGFDESLRAELRKTAPGVLTTVVCPFYVDTGMFRGVRTRFSWLLPILDEAYVADRIVDAVKRGRRRLLLPPLVGMVPLLRILPVGLFDWIVTFLGVNASMDDFKGRG